MSLSRVLRELVFVPLGGLNRSKFRRYLALVVTMVIGGAWHGATINFWLFGLYSGLALCALHWYHGRATDTGSTVPWPPVAGLLATWLSLIVTVVFFRAGTVQTAWSMFRGMAGFTGITSSPAPLSLKFSQFVPEPVLLNLHGLALWKFAILVSGACVIVLAFRNSNEIVGVGRYPGVWRPSFKWGLFSGCMAALAIGSLGSASRFLYVNF